MLKEFYLTKAIGDFSTSPSEPSTVLLRTEVAEASIQYGVSLLNEGKEYLKSVKWLQSGIRILERIESFATPQVSNLLSRALRKLSRACLLASDEEPTLLASAELSLNEYSKLRRSRGEPTSDSRLDFLRFEIHSKRDRSEEDLSSSFHRICESLRMSQMNINNVLRLLRANSSRKTFYSDGFKMILHATLDQEGHEFVSVVLLTFTFSMSTRESLETFEAMLASECMDKISKRFNRVESKGKSPCF